MICGNCGYLRVSHVGENLSCIGRGGSFQRKIETLTATFLYLNINGVAESRDAALFNQGRPLARIDNIVQELLGNGNTDISINIAVN